ncbi:MAG: ABC transporter permease [Halobacteria archaeon]
MKFLDIALNDLRILSKDRRALVLMFLLPMIIITIVGLALSGIWGGGIKIRVLVVDQDDAKISHYFLDYLNDISVLNVDVEANEFTARELVKSGRYGQLIIIPPDFSKKVLSGINAEIIIVEDPTQESSSAVVEKIVEGFTNRVSSNVIAVKTVNAFGVPVYSEKQIDKIVAVANKFAEPMPVSIAVESTSKSRTLDPFTQNVPGFSIMFLLLTCAQSGAVAILRERESGTLRRLLTAPIKRSTIIAGKLMSNYLKGLIQMTVLLLFGHFAFGLSFGEDYLAFALLIMAVTASAAGLGILISVFAQTKEQAESIATVIVLSMSAIGGSWWPIFIMPEFMQQLAHATINAWAMDGFYDLLWHGYGLAEILPEVAVLLTMAAIFLAIAASKFRFE